MAIDREMVRARLHEMGFDDARFARVGELEGAARALRDWLGAGHQADMAWLERTADKRADPRLVLPGARTAIMLGVNYWHGGEGENRESAALRPAWARYVQHADYHDTIREGLVAAGRMLEEVAGAAPTDYRYYVDTGPVLERGWAARAGIGFIGKNAMLISRRHGNWLFLAAILATLEFEPDPPVRPKAAGRETEPGLLCGHCTRCIDACPTRAIVAAGTVDARRCISYQTIENRGVIPRALRAGIGHRVYGCDVCLEVCPWNRFAQAGRSLLLTIRAEPAQLSLREILELTPERFAAVFRKTAVKRLKLAGLLRNACVVAGNLEARDCLAALLALATHPNAVVRAHAVWAVHRLGAGERLAEIRAAETDGIVLEEYAAEF